MPEVPSEHQIINDLIAENKKLAEALRDVLQEYDEIAAQIGDEKPAYEDGTIDAREVLQKHDEEMKKGDYRGDVTPQSQNQPTNSPWRVEP